MSVQIEFGANDVTTDDKSWKKHLLNTSVPLEHEAARVLSDLGFSVSADYAYSRWDSGVPKDFSVDIRGVTGTGAQGKFGGRCLLDVFIECKYRDRGTTWLFLPQPRDASKRLGDALQAVDLFSPKFEHDLWASEDREVPQCYSGVEVYSSSREGEKSKGRALDSHLVHGVRQLQYALPSMIMLRARFAALMPLEENFPFFFAPILVTNAPLHVAHSNFSVEAVESANALADISDAVACLIWSADLGPDFFQHCQREFAGLRELAATSAMVEVEASRKAAREAPSLLPSALARRISFDPNYARHLAEFQTVIVVNVRSLPLLAKFLRDTFATRANALKDEPLVKFDPGAA